MDRRSPSSTRVAIIWTVGGAILGAAFFALATDYTGRRDAMLIAHEARIQTLERSEARRDAQFDEIMRTLAEIKAELTNQSKGR